jgi:hypothetical protein
VESSTVGSQTNEANVNVLNSKIDTLVARGDRDLRRNRRPAQDF